MSPPNPPLPAADEDEEEVAEEIVEEEEEEEEYEEEEVEEIEEEVEVEEEKQVEKKEEEKTLAEEKEEEKAVEESQVEEKLSIPSINDVVNFNAALSEFVSQWEGLQHFLDAIGASIDIRSKKLDALQIPPPFDKPDEQAVAATVKEETKPVQEKPSSDDQRAELHSICETMGGRFLRKFVCTRLSDLAWLRREVPAALGRAPDPPKLVFDAIGRFYLQGSKAYERNPTVINGRRACILILEFYVLSGCPSGVDSAVKENARVAAIAWRSRLVSEGGVKSATSVDALGLALFTASFGIPPEFDCEVMYDLLRLSNLKKKANVFHQSPILREKIPDIIEKLLSKDMLVEAVDLACAFGLKEKFPPIPLLSSVLHKSWLTAKEEPRERQSSLKSLKEASEKQLAVLKSVVKCLENNQLDPSEVASFSMYEKIAELETDIAKVELKLKNKNFKRMAEEVGLSKKPETQAKRSWSASAEASPGVPPHLMKQTQEQRSPALSESKDLNASFIPQSMHDDGFTGSHNGGSMGFLTGGVHGSAGVGSSLVAAATADGAGPTPGNGIPSYANISGTSYGWHQDGVLDDRSVAHNYSGFAPSAGWMGPSAAAAQSLYQPQASSLGIQRRSGSNLYRFADIVLERESYYNSSTSNAMPGAANPSYYSSYPS